MTDVSPLQPIDPKRLWRVLANRFNESELKNLVFELSLEYNDLDYENLPPGGRSDKARELVAHYQRRNQLPLLVSAIQKMRPDTVDEIKGLTRTTLDVATLNASEKIGDESLPARLEESECVYPEASVFGEVQNELNDLLNLGQLQYGIVSIGESLNFRGRPVKFTIRNRNNIVVETWEVLQQLP